MKRIVLLLIALLLFGCTAEEPAPPTIAPETTAAPQRTAAPEATAVPETTAAPEATAALEVTTPPTPETTARPAPQTTRSPGTTASPMQNSPHRPAVEAAWTALGRTQVSAQSKWPVDLVCAMLEGNGEAMAIAMGLEPAVYACYTGMTVTDWSLEAVEITRVHLADSASWVERVPLLAVTIAAGGTERLGPGTHRLVFVDGLMPQLLPIDDYITVETDADSAAKTYVQQCLFARWDNESFVGIRLRELRGTDGPFSAEDFTRYAADHLGPAVKLDFSRLSAVDGGYQVIGRGGAMPVVEFVGEAERDGETVVTVRFFADYSATVESRTVEYHLTRGPSDFILASTVTVSDSGLPVAKWVT